MTNLTILGTGNMGQAIASIAARGGHSVQQLGVDDLGTPVTGDVVILAVPFPAVADVITQRGEQLAGRIVVDITDPLDFETFDSLVVSPDSSAAAEIATALPQSRVLKAFNTTFAGTHSPPDRAASGTSTTLMFPAGTSASSSAPASSAAGASRSRSS